MTDKLKQFLNEHKPETISNLMRWTQYNDIKQEIMDLTSFLIGIPKFSERLYCLNNNLKAVPVWSGFFVSYKFFDFRLSLRLNLLKPH